jgi:hypothetical protein
MIAAVFVSVLAVLPPVHLQYDQVREYVDAGTPLPPPAAFDTEYERLKSVAAQHVEPQAQRAEVRSQALRILTEATVQERFQNLVTGTAFGLVGAAADANPFTHALAARPLSRASTEIAKQQYDARNAQMARQFAEVARGEVMQTLHSIPAVQRVSIWGDWVRIDSLADGTAMIYKPEMGTYIALDTINKRYRVVQAAAATAAPDMCGMFQTPQILSLGLTRIDGLPAHGYRIGPMSLVNGGGGFTSTSTVYYWDTPLPQATLARATQSPQTACWGLPGDRLALYSAQTTQNADPARNRLSFNSVLMRGHVRQLTGTDSALFNPPSDYTPIQ